jgi:hypothetical protein
MTSLNYRDNNTEKNYYPHFHLISRWSFLMQYLHICVILHVGRIIVEKLRSNKGLSIIPAIHRTTTTTTKYDSNNLEIDGNCERISQ